MIFQRKVKLAARHVLFIFTKGADLTSFILNIKKDFDHLFFTE
jgi:hypothetical protein